MPSFLFVDSAFYASGTAVHHVVSLFRGDQVPVIADGVAQGRISSGKVDAFLLGLPLQQAPDQTGSEGIAAAHTIIDLNIHILAGDIVAVAGHHDALPVVQAGRGDLTQRITHHLNVGVLFHDLLGNLFIAHGVDLGIILIGVFGFDAQHGLKVLLVADDMAYDCGNYDFNNFEQQCASASVGIKNCVFDGPAGKFNELSDQFDAWLQEGASTADEEERIAIYTELYNAFYDTHTLTPVIVIPSCIAYNKDLDAVAVPTDYRVYDWSWKA